MLNADKLIKLIEKSESRAEKLLKSRSYRLGYYLLHPQKLITNKIKKISIEEVDLLHKFLTNTKGVDIKNFSYIDVGAHIGKNVKLFQEANVIAFEPSKTIYKKLVNNFEDKKNIKMLNLALSDSDGKLMFYESKESTGINSLSPFHHSHNPSYEVSVSTLTKQLESNNFPKVDLLKVDTEGFDLNVLRGLDFEKYKPKYIVAEFEDYKTLHQGYTSEDLFNFLENHGYHIITSKWFPVKRYGRTHEWDGLYCSTGAKCLSSIRDWGNFIAFESKKDYILFLQKYKSYMRD